MYTIAIHVKGQLCSSDIVNMFIQISISISITKLKKCKEQTEHGERTRVEKDDEDIQRKIKSSFVH